MMGSLRVDKCQSQYKKYKLRECTFCMTLSSSHPFSLCFEDANDADSKMLVRRQEAVPLYMADGKLFFLHL